MAHFFKKNQLNSILAISISYETCDLDGPCGMWSKLSFDFI